MEKDRVSMLFAADASERMLHKNVEGGTGLAWVDTAGALQETLLSTAQWGDGGCNTLS